MKWFSRLALGVLALTLIGVAGYWQFGREVPQALADVAVTPWPTSATTGTHLMVVSMTTSTNWIAPDGVTSVIVEAWGAGGSARPSATDGCAGGGAYARSVVSVTPGTAYPIVVGKPGAVGNSGTTSTFATTTVVAAPGWGWNQGGAGGAIASSTGDVRYSGHTAAGATSNAGGSAGDEGDGTGLRGPLRGAPPGSFTDRRITIPGGSGCDVADTGAYGMVTLTYSSTSLSGFPYVRERRWGDFLSYSGHLNTPTSTQVGDVLITIVAQTGSTGPYLAMNCSQNCGGWNRLFSSSTVVGSTAVFYKVATTTGVDFFVASSSVGSNPSYAYTSLAVANADESKLFFATSSANTSSYGDPPSLDTGASDNYLWIDGASSIGLGGRWCMEMGTTGTLMISPRDESLGKGLIWRERFNAQQTLNPDSYDWLTSNCTGSIGDWFSFTVAIAGLAAAPDTTPLFNYRPQRIINIY